MKKGTCLLCDRFWTCNKRKANGGCDEYIRKNKKATQSKEKQLKA
ncbi:MAG: hypothetical protein OSJ71_13770 [Acetatifactor sp.]|nr:hypothetical protein [Acetatifactor sp.]